jgi:hypothetical protein
MNQAEVENGNLNILMRAAEAMALTLCEGARKDQSKRQLLATLNKQMGSLRVRCPACAEALPVLLGQEDARHICVVARRSNFLTVRRRLEEHFRKARLKCPSCAARAENRGANEEPDVADENPGKSDRVAEGTACTATRE